MKFIQSQQQRQLNNDTDTFLLSLFLTVNKLRNLFILSIFKFKYISRICSNGFIDNFEQKCYYSILFFFVANLQHKSLIYLVTVV